MQIPLIRPCFSEKETQGVMEVVRSTWVHEGKKVQEFEQRISDYVGVRHAVAFFNGTVALHAALVALGIGPGDEVIVPSFTFFSTVSTVVQVGATPIFADITPDTYCIDPQDIARRITSRTRAIIPVHYGGLAADLHPLMDLSEKHGLLLIEDAAESLGSEYHGRKAGSFGKLAMFSFTPTKIITTGEGGILTTGDEALALRLRLLKNHGMDRPYHHIYFGFNYRMTEMQAALGIPQLERVEKIVAGKRKTAASLHRRLRDIEGITLPCEPPGRLHTFMMYTVRLKDRTSRDLLSEGLRKQGIENKIYFPPVHLQPLFKETRVRLPVTEQVSATVLSLPCYAGMTEDEIEEMAAQIRKILGDAT